MKYKFKVKKKRRNKNKKFKFKIDFTKLIVAVVLIFGIRWVELSYGLAGQGFDSNSDVTVTVVSCLLGVVISGYFAKSFGEKNSRNKNHITEDGLFDENYLDYIKRSGDDGDNR